MSKFLKIAVTGLFLINISIQAGEEPPGLSRVLWTCSVPCEPNSPQEETHLLKANAAWCGEVVLTPEMIDRMTSICQKANHREDVHAARISKNHWDLANCITSGNPCKAEGPREEGLAKVGYSCSVTCPGDKLPRKFGVCAYSNWEAWSAAGRVCEAPSMPSEMPLNQVCDPNGQTGC